MGKGGRSYIPVAVNRSSYKLFVDDVRTWRQIIKKKTPRLPTYDEAQTLKWEEQT